MGLVRLTLQEPQHLTPLYVNYQEFLLDGEAARYTPKTLDHYKYTLGSFLSWLQIRGLQSPQEISPNYIREYLVSLQRRGLKDTTQHVHPRGIKTWLRWLVDEGELEDSPMRRVSMPRPEKRMPPPFSPEDIKALLAACNLKTPKGMRDKAMVLGLLDSGLRASELVSLQVKSVDLRSAPVMVIGKRHKQRTVRFGAQTRKRILRYLATRQELTPESMLWVAYRKSRTERDSLTLRGLEIVCSRLGEKAGVMPCHPHRFRRTFALCCLRDGMDLRLLRLLMGHSSLTVLQRYLALTGEDIERAHRVHSPVDSLL